MVVVIEVAARSPSVVGTLSRLTIQGLLTTGKWVSSSCIDLNYPSGACVLVDTAVAQSGKQVPFTLAFARNVLVTQALQFDVGVHPLLAVRAYGQTVSLKGRIAG
jgi:hypothetical protein